MRKYSFAAFAIAVVVVTTLLFTGGSEAASVPTSQDAFATENGGWPGFSETDTRILIGDDSGNSIFGGWRFTGLGIPANSVITGAHVELVQQGYGHIFSTTFAFEDAQDAQPFWAGSTPLDRWAMRTSAAVGWAWPRGNPGDVIKSPSLIASLQELVDSHGSINNVVLIEAPGSDLLAGQSHAWGSIESGDGAVLVVEFSTDGGTGGTGGTGGRGGTGGTGDPELVYSMCSRDQHMRLVDSEADCDADEKFVQIDLNEVSGQPGLNCWDLNENGVKDPEEDVNSDGEVNVYDCRATAVATPTPVLPTATATPGTGGPTGTAVIAVGAVNDQNGRDVAENNHYWGLGETLFLRAEDDSSIPWLATDWVVLPDLSGAILTIRQGVPFQDNNGDFGELTAHDVAFSMNHANAATNSGSGHGQAGEFASLWGEWRAINDTLISFDFNQFDATWKDNFLNQSGQSFVVFSQEAFDTMGSEWARNHIVATGPFEVESWDASTQLTMASRYAGGGQHYLPELTPKTHRVQFIQVPNASTRAALLSIGGVDAATVDPDGASALIADGFGKTGTGGGNQEGIFFSGNLWEKYSAREGEGEGEPNETLLSRETYYEDFPWIGDPFDAADPGDMEEARLVRRALALAIDREAIVQDVLGGVGNANQVQYFSSSHPNWNSKWDYGYDPDEARSIISGLVDANYFKGTGDPTKLNGNAFEISLYSQSGDTTIRGPIGDAVAGYWADLGLETFSLKFPYQPVFRPTVVNRTNVLPWVTACDLGAESYPWHFPKGLVQTSLTRGGFGCGFESPEIVDLYQTMATAPDFATATQAATNYLDYVYYWNLQPGVVVVPNDVYLNPDTVAEWPMAKSYTSPIDSVWNLTLK